MEARATAPAGALVLPFGKGSGEQFVSGTEVLLYGAADRFPVAGVGHGRRIDAPSDIERGLLAAAAQPRATYRGDRAALIVGPPWGERVALRPLRVSVPGGRLRAMSFADLSLDRWRALDRATATRRAQEVAVQVAARVVRVESVEHLGAPL
jgi:hypothetical protein